MNLMHLHNIFLTIYAIIGYNKLYMNLLDKLQNFRLENKMSQQRLAKILGVHFSTVNRWFKGHTKPNKIQEYHIKKILKGKDNE